MRVNQSFKKNRWIEKHRFDLIECNEKTFTFNMQFMNRKKKYRYQQLKYSMHFFRSRLLVKNSKIKH